MSLMNQTQAASIPHQHLCVLLTPITFDYLLRLRSQNLFLTLLSIAYDLMHREFVYTA
jgi:hypothetical protein